MENQPPLSADELQAKLEALAQERDALEVALEQRRQQEKSDLAAEIKAMIQERGHDLDEISDLVLGRPAGRKRRRQRTAANDSNASYTRYADPDNPDNVYIRGRLPNWMIEKMAANGYDPANAEHRQQFKSEHLVQLAA